MFKFDFDNKIAQKIVERTMAILDVNINVMDSSGYIIGSGDQERLGTLHEGALLTLAKGNVVEINEEMASHLKGVKQGINLPLYLNSQIIGVIGLTGDPDKLFNYGKLVCMTAEMMIEQSYLIRKVALESRLRDEFVLGLIKDEEISQDLIDWSKRLNVDISLPRIAIIIELFGGQLTANYSISELQQLQAFLMEQEKEDLVAITSFNRLVILHPVQHELSDKIPENSIVHAKMLIELLKSQTNIMFKTSIGKLFQGPRSIAKSFYTADVTLRTGYQKNPDVFFYSYYEYIFPVVLDGLRNSWQYDEIAHIIKILSLNDKDYLLRSTLNCYFESNMSHGFASKKLNIHRNTLDYRLKKIQSISGLNLQKIDDLLFLYIALTLDKSKCE